MSGLLPKYSFEDWVVGVGASAGGLEALSSFVSNVPAEFNGSIIIAQHLAPHSKSMMVELLSRQSNLRVIQAEHQTKLEPSTIYVVPPNHDLDILKSRIVLTVADDAIRPKPSVDEFFESLARACGSKCVGIVLSGTGTDGARGIESIKNAGGITIAQDNLSAKYDGMPRSAVDTGKVDSILPPEIIAQNLIKTIIEHESRARASKLDPKGLKPIFDVIKDRLGQDFTQYKSSTINRRIAKRMSFLRLEDYESYLEHLKATPGEVGELAKDLLISVTSFFRDKEVFDEMRERLISIFRKHSQVDEFRVWVAGCATGEEAYSIAMLCLDLQETLRRPFPIKVFATDLDHDAIAEARNGVYDADQLNSIPERYRAKFVQTRSVTSIEVTKRVRDCVVFAKQDLIQNPPFVKLQMISCRNVMIYFEAELQRKVLEIFHYALEPSGMLVLGKSESILSTPSLFEVVDRKNKIFEKLNVPSHALHTTKISKANPFEIPTTIRKNPTIPSVAEIAQKKIIRAFDIAGVVVDTNGTIIQVVGDITPYLTFQNFQPDMRLMNLLPKTVGIEIPVLLRKADQSKSEHKSRIYKIGKGLKSISFQIGVSPLLDEEEDGRDSRNLILVTFEPKKAKEVKAKKSEETEVSTGSLSASRLSELEQELYLTKEHLQSVIEELGVTNEELQSLNEELSSTNEELQASNEELETTNEELQSSNEELTTVNEELNAKSNELRSLSLSLENIQNSIGSGLIILDSKLRLLRYNNEALKIFFASEADIGRDFARISSRCEITNFETLAKRVLETGMPSESICENGSTIYQMRMLPSFDEGKKIIGVILVFIDNTDRIRIQDKLFASEERTRAIIEASPSLISLKDNMGRYLVVNSAFKHFFNLQGEVIGKTDREVLRDEAAIQLRDADLEVFVTRNIVRREETITDADGNKRVLLSNRFPLMDPSGRTPVAVGTISIDITKQVEAQEKLQKSETLYRAVAEDQAVIVCRFKPDGSFTYMNESFATYFGMSEQAIQKKKFADLASPKDKASVEQSLNAINEREPVAQSENRVARWHNDNRWVRWIHKGLFDSKGQLVEIQTVGFDVTEWRTQTNELLQTEAIFSSIFNNTSDFITLYKFVDDTLELQTLNQSAAKTLGTAAGQQIGRRIEQFFPPEQARDMVARYKHVAETKKPQVFEEEIIIGGNVRHYLTTIVPIIDTEGKTERIAALSRDVSIYKAIESDLRVAKETAEIASRAKSEFLAAMSHELRTPLNVVLGFSQMLELSDLNVEQRDYVGSIHRSGQLLLTLIEDILDISKIEAGKIRLESVSFSVEELVTEVVELFSAQATAKKIELRQKISPRAKKNVIGDPNRLKQILVNFLGNALKFTSDGHVELAIDATETLSPGELKFRFAVTDTGIGVKESDKPKIFERFSQADSGHSRKFGGSGLGLTISKQLVTLMDGEVGFDSMFGKGSTFWFELPLTLTNKVSEVRSLNKIQKSSGDTRPLHVLIVDDSADSRTISGLFLKRLGHTCQAVDSGKNAIDNLKRNNYDLILMDMQMPEMDGCETTIAIRKIGFDGVPIIALTANALTEDVEKCRASGMNDYLSKPVRMEDLNGVLHKWAAVTEKSKQT